MKRSKFFWNVSILFTLIIIVWTGLNLRAKLRQVKIFVSEAETATVGTQDNELVAEIALLEDHLIEIANFRFQTKNNPLNLTKVVLLPDEWGRYLAMMDRDDIRISTILFGKKPTIVLHYHGKKHEMSVGESLEDIRIIEIKPEQVILSYKGERKVYSVSSFAM